ncbi:MAG: MerR family transcriptional regulator [Holophagae bacterium]|jgi:DNA-binding transcriptional MerR regulator
MATPSTYTLDDIENLTGFERRTVAYYVQQGLLPKVGRRGAKTRYPQLFIDRLMFIKMIRELQDRGEIGNLTLKEIGSILDRVPAETVADVVAGREPLDAVDVRVDPEMPPDLVPDSAGGKPSSRDEPRNGEGYSRPFAAPEPMSDVIEVDMSFADSRPSSQPAKAEDPHENRPLLTGLSNVRGLPGVDGYQSNPAEDPKPPPQPLPQPELKPEDTAEENQEKNSFPPVAEEDRLGWALARLQKVLTDAPRRKTGNTESWHRARITPELTISARNLPDKDAQMLDSVARILKQMLWRAWEE